VRIVSANVNGIRAAARRGGLAALAGLDPDIICLQEVRADLGTTAQVLHDSPLAGMVMRLAPGGRPGHAGVAILVRPETKVTWLDPPGASGQPGRWLECSVPAGRPVQIACAYAPTGAGGGPSALAKDDFLHGVGRWLESHGNDAALLVGDLNVAHTAQDIRNWRGNLGKPGFLPAERAHLDHWLADRPDGLGWRDIGRSVAGPGPGPFTWWSWRGRAFDNDSGWRIDYMLASPALSPVVAALSVARAPSYAERWSDHAALVLDLDLELDS
jgi:exodeoxyribonuclease-3